MSLAPKTSPQYQSYLVRLWRQGPQGLWRASAQSTVTQHIYFFVSIEALFAFLDARLVTGEIDLPPVANRDPPDL